MTSDLVLNFGAPCSCDSLRIFLLPCAFSATLWTRGDSVIEERRTSTEVPCKSPGSDPALEELSQKMLSWSDLWFGSAGNEHCSAEYLRVRKWLVFWLERCIGHDAPALVNSQSEDVSLATCTPLLRAFLGRRVMLEISRRVLEDGCSSTSDHYSDRTAES